MKTTTTNELLDQAACASKSWRQFDLPKIPFKLYSTIDNKTERSFPNEK
jgi:hypothetical protein